MFRRRPRPLLAVVVSVVLAAGALVFASTAGAATPRQQIASYASSAGYGAARGPYYDLASQGRQVTYRVYAKGLVAFNGRKVKGVAGAMLASYSKAGGVRGSLGAPVMSKRCGLTGKSCIQRFQGGSIFRSKSARKKTTIARVSGERSELIAVAKSQRGYKEPGYRRNKYGKWVNGGRYSNRAWCSFFLSWTSSASGNGRAMPKSKSFPSFVKAVRKRGNVKKSNPKVGDMAFTDYFRDGQPSHVGLVVAVHDTYVTTIEGNIDAAGRSGRPRGVHEVNRARSAVVFYATPDL